MIIESRTEWVRHTPLLRIRSAEIPETVKLYAKCEFLNPAGGIKDRFGLYALEQLIKTGELKPGMTIIEPTAGNTGLGFAFAAAEYGLKVICVVPEKFSTEKQQLLKALGAKIINTPASLGMEGAIDVAQNYVNQHTDTYMIQQFNNPLNSAAYEATVAPEIADELKHDIDVFVAGAGTGGTFSGIARYLKANITNVWNVLADPVGSTLGGGQSGEYQIEGIGNHFKPETFDRTLVNQVVKVSDQQAFARVQWLANAYGIFVGSSSGANLEAAIHIAQERQKGTIVTVFSDRGERYLSKGIYHENT